MGAGVAGLVAAHELKRAGHEPLILEGQHRVGGRVHTLRHPFTEGSTPRWGPCASRGPRTDPGIHLKIPAAHARLHHGQPERLLLHWWAKDSNMPRRTPTPVFLGFETRKQSGTARPEPVDGSDRAAAATCCAARAMPPGMRSSSKYDQYSTRELPRGKGMVRGGDRDVRPAGQPGGGHELLLPGGVPRGRRATTTPICSRSRAAPTDCRTHSCRSYGRISASARR